jgi:hypothetical protein
MTSFCDCYWRRLYTAPYLSVTLPLAHVAANLYIATLQKLKFGKHCGVHFISLHCQKIWTSLFAGLFYFYIIVTSVAGGQHWQHCHDCWKLESYLSLRLLCVSHFTRRAYVVFSECGRRVALLAAVPLHPCCLTLPVHVFSGRRKYVMIPSHIHITSLQMRFILLMSIVMRVNTFRTGWWTYFANNDAL